MSEDKKPSSATFSDPPSRYELVMLAAREARRINDMARLSGKEVKRRVTHLAWERLLQGKIKFTYSDEPLPEPKITPPLRRDLELAELMEEGPNLDEGA